MSSWDDTMSSLLGLGARLRLRRAQPGAELLRAIVGRIDERRRERRRRALGATFALGLTASMAAVLSTVGGVSYAATAAREAVSVLKRAAAPERDRGRSAVRVVSAGSDQYQAGFEFGDPEHNHEGPPVVRRVDDDVAPASAVASREGLARLVTTRVSFSEQVGLWISVVDARGRPMLLTQRSRRGGSSVGAPVAGPQTKFIQYALLVPRALTIRLRVPANLLQGGRTYRVRILAIDPQGHRTTLLVPFRP